MTTSVQTLPLFKSGRLYRQKYYMDNLYTVIVNTEDGESVEYEIEAGSFAEATKQAEDMANDVLGDITYVEVYLAQ